ncbi:MAG: hydrogenase small subunit [Gammaproteobacteria bacterium]|nr:hydrogenase small subunit [Gammaproteobacteria bacterium]
MANNKTLADELLEKGISRRQFLKYCAVVASALALPPSMVPVMAESLAKAKRQSVIWLSFQECTGCTESLTRSAQPSIESLIFDFISLDYHHTLQAAAGDQAEHAREQAMAENKGKYLLIVDGSIPLANNGVYSTIAGKTNLQMLQESAVNAAAIVAVGTCAAYGGLPMAAPNPTGAVAVKDLIDDKPIINVPGCPPIGEVISGVLAHVLTFGSVPELDELGRPKAFYGENIHDRCYRRTFYDQGKFAETFDDEGARQGWCLYKLGCRGPITNNACATTKWNQGTSFPIESGHGCLGCSQPGFWDMGGFYNALSEPMTGLQGIATTAVAAGAAAGLVVAAANKLNKKQAQKKHFTVTAESLEKDAEK